MSIYFLINLYFALICEVVLLNPLYTCPKYYITSFYYKENHNICAKHGIIHLNTKRSKLISSDLPNDEDMASNSGLNGLYRPRSALARALYEKQRNDRHLQEFDQHEVSQLYLKKVSFKLLNLIYSRLKIKNYIEYIGRHLIYKRDESKMYSHVKYKQVVYCTLL